MGELEKYKKIKKEIEEKCDKKTKANKKDLFLILMYSTTIFLAGIGFGIRDSLTTRIFLGMAIILNFINLIESIKYQAKDFYYQGRIDLLEELKNFETEEKNVK